MGISYLIYVGSVEYKLQSSLLFDRFTDVGYQVITSTVT